MLKFTSVGQSIKSTTVKYPGELFQMKIMNIYKLINYNFKKSQYIKFIFLLKGAALIKFQIKN